MARINGIFHLPPENPVQVRETISTTGTTKAPRTIEKSIVVKDGMKYEKIVEFPFPDKYILLGPAEEPKKEEKTVIREIGYKCEACNRYFDSPQGLALHRTRIHKELRQGGTK